MKIQAVKGTRDFYPEEMAVRNWIMDGWKRVSVRNGFAEFDGPIFEYLQMYQIKSGDEIVEQLFSFEDRGERKLAIRPEITPTLARMVNQRINSLPRPIKWFSMPRLCRAERPQKGRLREFFQWNIDIIGAEDVYADAEVIFATLDYLQEAGLTASDVQAKISSRRLLKAMFEAIGFADDELPGLYLLLDKKDKLPAEAFTEMLAQKVADADKRRLVARIMDVKDLHEIPGLMQLPGEAGRAMAELKELFSILEAMGVAPFCRFDIGIVRGLAYYTGVVFEVHDIKGELRAVCGGGRYDNLLKDFGGPAVPATGMGMGDCVLEILLRERGLIDESLSLRKVDYFVAVLDESLRKDAISLTAKLRRKGKRTEVSYKGGGLGKQLKAASDAGAARCIIFGKEYIEERKLAVKDMATGVQQLVGPEELLLG
ncbi:MAG TPA: histidine--tRNA ligase [Sedimentisphaerales bacterium]|nr:histidine--tRNA ligase [Sedimentisphaerales bacterium]